MPKLSLFKPTLFSASQGGQELGGRSIMEMGRCISMEKAQVERAGIV
jgi:hypothetical protein